jgi:hypothetical protein
VNRRACVIALLVSTQALAQSEGAAVGRNSAALPGVHRVGIARPSEVGLSGALTLGYGLTEPQVSESSAHHRALVVPAASVTPLPWLTLAALAECRYDVHPGGDDGFVADPQALARVGTSHGSFHFGAELGAWFPGSESIATTLDAISPHVQLLAGTSRGSLAIGAQVGFRWDRSAAAGDSAARLSRGDRLALGLSDSNAVLAGIGAAYRLGATELLLETSADMLVGSDAPRFARSPLRAAVGARHHPGRALELQLLIETSLSARPASAPTDPLVPVEPRLQALAGAVYTFGFAPVAPSRPPVKAIVAKPQAPVVPRPAAPPPAGSVRLTIVDAQGAPVLVAEVELSLADGTLRRLTNDNGNYLLMDVPTGPATLTIRTPEGEPITREIDVGAGSPLEISIELPKRGPVPGQLRGLIRSLNGAALPAAILVEPLGLEIKTDAQGYFEADLPPGKYNIVIESSGYRSQRRAVDVQSNGVVVINADLHK